MPAAQTSLPAIVILLAFTCLAGCGHKGSAKLEGHWRGTRADGVGANVQDAANAFAAGTEIVAKGNVITITTPAPTPAQKKDATPYTIDDETKTTLTLHTDKDGPANKESFVFADDGKTMTWKLGDGRSILFAKQN